MDVFDEAGEEVARGLSRRQLLGRVGGGLAGVTLASLGLDLGRAGYRWGFRTTDGKLRDSGAARCR